MFDFDKVTNRRGTNSLKWDVGENELPLWVADMDFPTAPAIVNAVKARAESEYRYYHRKRDIRRKARSFADVCADFVKTVL